MRRYTAVFCLLTLFVPIVFSDGAKSGGLLTNAESGTVNAEKRVWFSVGEGEQLRLFVDGAEQYRGPGPGTILLAGNPGEERYEEVVAERHALPPDGKLLETKRFTFFLDFKAPNPPSFSVKSLDGGKILLSVAAEDGASVVAAFDREGAKVVRRTLKAENELPSCRFALIGWAVDRAGNRSAPVSFSYEPFSLSIVNPVVGIWSNRQTLAVEAPGSSEIVWSIDGSDPLTSGQRYGGPILIDASGSIHLRCAARAADGRIERRDLTYTVSDALPADLGFLAESERKGVVQNTLFQLPDGYRWDTATGSVEAPSFAASRPVVLRPLAQISRLWPLVVASDRARFRFVYRLGPLAPESSDASVRTESGPLLFPVQSVPLKEPSFQGEPVQGQQNVQSAPSGAISDKPSPFEPVLVVSRRVRVLDWPSDSGLLRVRFSVAGTNPGSWVDCREPFILPVEGGNLDWFLDKGATTEGPFRITMPPLDAASGSASIAALAPAGTSFATPVVLSSPSAARCTLALSPSGEGLSPVLYSLSLAAGQKVSLDLCEGEDCRLSILSDSEKPLFDWNIDRRAPVEPELTAPAEGTWLSNPVSVGAHGDGQLHTLLSWDDPSGKTLQKEISADEYLGISGDGPVSYSLESWAEDAAGNRSASVSRHFTLDAATVYVRAPAVSASGVNEDGSRAAPYSDLATAFAAVRREGRRMIHLSGDFTVSSALEIPSGLTIEGGFSGDWQKGKTPSLLRFTSSGALSVRGTKAALVSLSLVAPQERNSPLLSLGDSASVSGRACSFNSRGLLFLVDSSSLALSDTSLIASGSAVRAVSGTVVLSKCRAELAGSVSSAGGALSTLTAFDLDRSKCSIDDLTLVCSAADSTQAFLLKGTDLHAKNLNVDLKGARYACAVDAAASTLDFETCSLSATAQDVALATLDGGVSLFLNSRLTVRARGVSRAFDARGETARLVNCTLFALGDAPRSEVFAGAAPAPGTVTGNSFIGWDWLWTERYSPTELASFDRRFAARGKPNTVSEVPR